MLGVLGAVLACGACASGTDAPACTSDEVCLQAYGPGAFCNASGVCQPGVAPGDAASDGGDHEGGPTDAGVDDDAVSPPPPVDMGTPPPVDMGTPPPVDMGTPPPVDMGTPPMDMGTPPPVDMGTPSTDMGTPPTDMGTPPMDMGTPPTDMGTPPVDMGPRDMGSSPAPPPGSIVINEIDYDQLGTDTAEFVELYNTTASPIALTGLSLLLLNCASPDLPAEYTPSPLALSGTVAAHGYVVIAPPGVGPAASGTVVRVDVAGLILQNAGSRAGDPGDGLLLLHVASSTAIDAVAYEGRCGTVRIGGRDLAVMETNATVAADSNDVAGSLARIPDGTDSGDNSRDFTFTMTLTPGAANR